MKELRLIELLKKRGFGSRMGLRSQGKQIREDLEAELKLFPEKEVLVLDFSGLEVISYSFADEVVATPLSRLVSGEYGEKYFVLRIDPDELCEDIGVSLEKRDLAAIRIRGGGRLNWSILGKINEELRRTLEFIAKEGPVSTGTLTGKMKLNLQACSNRVVELARLRLIRRERVEGERGVKYENIFII